MVFLESKAIFWLLTRDVAVLISCWPNLSIKKASQKCSRTPNSTNQLKRLVVDLLIHLKSHKWKNSSVSRNKANSWYKFCHCFGKESHQYVGLTSISPNIAVSQCPTGNWPPNHCMVSTEEQRDESLEKFTIWWSSWWFSCLTRKAEVNKFKS